MSPVFLIVVAAALLAGRLLLLRRMASAEISDEHREGLEAYVTGLFAVLAPLVGAVLCLLAILLVAQSPVSTWLLAIAGVLFCTDLLLVLRQRRRLTGGWLRGGTAQTNTKARVNRLAVLAAVCFVGHYVVTWSLGDDLGTWGQVVAVGLLVALIALMVGIGWLTLMALQERANNEYAQRHGSAPD